MVAGKVMQGGVRIVVTQMATCAEEFEVYALRVDEYLQSSLQRAASLRCWHGHSSSCNDWWWGNAANN